MVGTSLPKPRALLAIHGFSGHPEELRFLATQIGRQVDAAVYLPTLPGHGTSPGDLATKRHEDWYQAVVTAYDNIARNHHEIILIGNSFGANLALKLASERSVGAVVGISIPRTRWYQAWFLRFLIFVNQPFRSLWRKPTTGKYATEVIPGYTQRAYEEIPLGAMRELLRFEAQETRPHQLRRVEVPTLLVVPAGDPFVPHEAATYYHAHLGTKNKKILPWNDHYHLVVQGERKLELGEAISRWLKEQLYLSGGVSPQPMHRNRRGNRNVE